MIYLSIQAHISIFWYEQNQSMIWILILVSFEKEAESFEQILELPFQTWILHVWFSCSSWLLFRQYFEAGISEVEEELDEMEGPAI